MPYPAKIDRQAVLSVALEELAANGIRDLSLRSLAASLKVAPNAIYRYFADKAALEAALADESARLMEMTLRKAARGHEAELAIRRMASAYMKFARNNHHLYNVMMSFHETESAATSHLSLWNFTVEQVERLAGRELAAGASVALWAFLHGAVGLTNARVFGELKPSTGVDFGLDAWFQYVIAQRGANTSVHSDRTVKGSSKGPPPA